MRFVPRCWFPSFVVNRVLVLISKKCISYPWTHPFSWTWRPKKWMPCSGWLSFSWESWTSAGWKNWTPHKSEDKGRVVFTAFTSFTKHLSQVGGIEDGVIFWRTPVDKFCLLQADNLQQNTQKPHYLKLRCIHLHFTWCRDIQAEMCLDWNCSCTLSLFLSSNFTVS